MALVRYTWNCPKNVSKDAKFSVRRQDKKLEVGVTFKTAFGENWALSTGKHAKLVEMVNSVKLEATGSLGGTFYITEYRQVIVPTAGDDDAYFYAGEYLEDLEFHFEGHVISGAAVDDQRKALKPGDPWSGVHPGIPFKLKAGGKDIAFIRVVKKNVTREELLSEHSTVSQAKALAERIRAIKGFEGGRFYVNERRHIFAPLKGEGGVEYVYITDLLPSDPWFPKWIPSQSAS